MAAARDAAEHYISTDLQPQDRVAVFTTGAMLTDFTSDPKLLHEALLKLRTSPRSRTLDHDCPQLSDFQAQQIMENPNNQNIDAWKVANTELAGVRQRLAASGHVQRRRFVWRHVLRKFCWPITGRRRLVARWAWQLNARNFWRFGDRRCRAFVRRICIESDSANALAPSCSRPRFRRGPICRHLSES